MSPKNYKTITKVSPRTNKCLAQGEIIAIKLMHRTPYL